MYAGALQGTREHLENRARSTHGGRPLQHHASLWRTSCRLHFHLECWVSHTHETRPVCQTSMNLRWGNPFGGGIWPLGSLLSSSLQSVQQFRFTNASAHEWLLAFACRDLQMYPCMLCAWPLLHVLVCGINRRGKNKQTHQRCLAASATRSSFLCNVGPVTGSQLPGLKLPQQQRRAC